MDTLVALGQLLAYLAVVGAIALLVDRLLGDADTGRWTLFHIDVNPPRTRRVQDEELVRWNVDRLGRPTRIAAPPTEPAVRSLGTVCSP